MERLIIDSLSSDCVPRVKFTTGVVIADVDKVKTEFVWTERSIAKDDFLGGGGSKVGC